MTVLKRATAVFLTIVLTPALARAWPVLDEPHVVAGLRCYPDHASSRQFWYVPDRLSLAVSQDASPALRFHRFRYTGTSASGDSGRFWVKGVLGFRVSFPSTTEARALAESTLEASLGRPVSLEPLTLTAVEASLVYVTAGDEALSESLEGGVWDAPEGAWTERSYTLALSPRTTELLWDAYHRDAVALSLNYGFLASGLSTRPDREAGDRRGPEPVVEPVGGGAIAVHVSPAECPSCFQSTELDAEIPAGYTLLDVFCHDFQSPEAPSDLALVVVDVRATALTGEPTEERLRFEAGGATRQPLHFKFAVRIDDGYDVVVSRVFGDGRVERGSWRHVDSWNALQDVTAYRRAVESDALDARQLY